MKQCKSYDEWIGGITSEPTAEILLRHIRAKSKEAHDKQDPLILATRKNMREELHLGRGAVDSALNNLIEKGVVIVINVRRYKANDVSYAVAEI